MFGFGLMLQSGGKKMERWELNVAYVKGSEELNRESAETGCVKCFG